MKFLPTILMVCSLAFSLFSQVNQNGNVGYLNPDSLTNVTITGLAIVDTSTSSAKYYLDEDGDGTAEYFLNFGPYWYEPDSGLATRPLDGDSITVFGGLVDSCLYSSILYPVVIVYEINGEFWRDPFEPLWSHMGRYNHHRGRYGHAYGWRNNSLETIQVSGTVLLDTTFTYAHFYLDSDNDSIPEYILNFGPPWYEPVDSTLTLPEDGDVVTVLGALVEKTNYPMIIVFELDGLVWRDSTLMHSNLGGNWIYRNMNQYRYVHAPFDTGDGMRVGPGWQFQNGPDSLFCQMLQVFPQNLPNTENQNVFAGYEIGVFNKHSNNLMIQNQNIGGSINFAAQVQFQFHYNDIQLKGNNTDEGTIQVKAWDNSVNDWILIDNTVLNAESNTITFSSYDVYNLFALTGESTVTTAGDPNKYPNAFTLKQNYPNPFNPVTNIEFSLSSNSKVVLTVYNVLGQKLFDLMNKPMTAGVYNFHFDGASLPSGIYYYELKIGQQSKVKKMILLK